MSTQYLTPPSGSRPLPRRLLSLQHPLTPSQTPKDYTYPSPTSPNSPTTSRPSLSPTAASRPGAPRRSHSFCGDPSASTYALASTSSAGHLSKDKRQLVAPPLERTLSSIGSRGNFSTNPRMTRPGLPTPPSSPPPVPQIFVQRSSPTRPGVTPVQPSLTRRDTLSESFDLVTPSDSNYMSFGDPHQSPAAKAIAAELMRETDDVEMLEVDGMVEGVEDLTME